MIDYQQVQVNLVMAVVNTEPKSLTQIAKLVGLPVSDTCNALNYLESMGVVYRINHKQAYHYVSEYDPKIRRLK